MEDTLVLFSNFMNLLKIWNIDLQDYLVSLIEVLQRNPDCILHPTRAKLYSKQILHQLHPFFRRGLFELNKYGTA